jgi:hypothetical protein
MQVKKRIAPFDDPNQPPPGMLPDDRPNIVGFDPSTPGADPADTELAQKIIDENEIKGKECGELFYVDEDGNRRDADLHNPILGDETPEEALEISRKIAAEFGLTPEQIERMFGVREPRKND